MSNQSNTVALSLQQILLGISDSLTEAQSILNETAPYDQYGRPNVVYQLPYLDFKLQVTSSFESTREEDSSADQVLHPDALPTGKGKYYQSEAIMFKPVQVNETSTVKNEILSTISGRFIANVPNEGLPQVILSITSEKGAIVGNGQEYQLKVLLSNAAGERLASNLIELNFDDLSSNPLNGGQAVAIPTLDRAEARTDINGEVTFRITLPINDYNNGRYFVFTVNSGAVYKEFSLSKF